jgi:geranyl-CoA carboxylase alpha subunit
LVPPVTAFSKILIANRGEIACRIARTARAMGYRSVAVYSEVDREAPHVAAADQAVPIGPSAAAQSYLAIDKIIAAARRTGADAIHPGYGFLSENADFATACAAADIAFIGPRPDAIRAMGNKAAARRQVSEIGIPCIPGYDGAEQSDAVLARAAAVVGFPLMVKAAFGGGGKGMRLVGTPDRLGAALSAARSEAKKAFGFDDLILEKAIEEPRHVEVQIFADGQGNVIQLFERDCSIQRRHQKIIEEAPSPAMTPALRRAMGEAASAIASAIGYVGAGTIEFLLAPDGHFYFLEMNTRLQVEHPVTEMITGLDLVEWQLRIAAGETLPLRQDAVPLDGYAIEARLCAEDAAADFLPQAGTVLAWEVPAGPGLRVDHAMDAGLTISPYYDPLLAKIVAHGATREEARRRLVSALRDTLALGIETNRRFLVDCLSHPAFVAGDTSTAFIERHFPAPARRKAMPEARMIALAAALIGGAAEPGAGAWHSSGKVSSPMMLSSGETKIALGFSSGDAGRCRIAWNGESHDLEILAIDGTRIRFLADGLVDMARFAWEEGALLLSLDGVSHRFEDVLLAPRDGNAAAGAGAALAPMTGMIAAVRVKPGDAVRKGQCLVILEAMKMEHEILAPRDGMVASVLVAPGEQVVTRKLLVELAPPVGE